MGKTWTAQYTLDKKEKLIFVLIYSIAYTMSLMPLCILYLLSDFLYVIMYKVIGYRKAVVRNNLTTAFPEKSEKEILDIEGKFFHFLCDYIFETIKLVSMSKEEMRRRVTFSGIEKIQKAADEGRGTTLYMGHYCNWEWITGIGLHLPENTHGCQIYHVVESKVFDKLMLKIRSRMGTENIPRFETLRRLITLTKEKKNPVIGFISDQSPDITAEPKWLPFLNHDTPFITGTERISKKLNLNCVYLDIQRTARGYYHVDIITIAEYVKGIPDWELTERYSKAMEKSIIRQPEFWLWSHRRWKHNRASFINSAENKAKNS